LIDFGEWLEKHDAAVLLTGPPGFDGIVGKAFGPDGLFVRRLVLWLDHQRKAGGLYAGQCPG